MKSERRPAVYLAHLNHSRKRKGIQPLKALFTALDLKLNPVPNRAAIACLLEGKGIVPHAHELLGEAHPLPDLAVLHLDLDPQGEGPWYVNAPAGKRKAVDWDQFFLDQLQDLKLVFVGRGASLDLIEKVLFAGSPAVIGVNEDLNPKAAIRFRNAFYAAWARGLSLEEAFDRARAGFDEVFTIKEIPSDPYAYWEAKEKMAEEHFAPGLYYLSANAPILQARLLDPEQVPPLPEVPALVEAPMKIFSRELAQLAEARNHNELRHLEMAWMSGQAEDHRRREESDAPSPKKKTVPSPIAKEPKTPEPQTQLTEIQPGTVQPSPHKESPVVVSSAPEPLSVAEPIAQAEPVSEPTMRSYGDSVPKVATRSRWKNMIGIGLGVLGLVSAILFFINQHQSDPAQASGEDSYLSTFASTESYNILLLPFKPYPNCEAKDAYHESAVRDRLNVLKESDELGIEVVFVDEGTCPQNGEDAHLIGEVYQANLVVWGNYAIARKDTGNIHVRYVSLGQPVEISGDRMSNLGRRAFNDIYELQEGHMAGEVTDIVYWLLGVVNLKNEAYQSALSYLDQINLADNAEYGVIHHMRAKCYQGLGMYDQVLTAYNEAIQLNPEDANAYHNRGLVYQRLQQPEQALADFQEALRLNPQHKKARHNRRLLMEGNGETSQVDRTIIEPDLEEETELAELPEVAPLLVSRSVVASEDAPAAEIEDLSSSTSDVQTTPATTAAEHHRRGYALERQGANRKALEAYTQAILVDPSQASGYYDRALLYEKMGQFEEALADYGRAIKYDARNTDLYHVRAYLLERMNRHYDAIFDYTKIIDLRPDKVAPYLYRGKAYHYVKRVEQAMADFNQAIQLNGQDASGFYFRGKLHRDLNKHKEALADYSRAIQLNPGYGSAYRERAELHMDRRQYRKALPDLDQGLTLNPHDAGLLTRRALCYLKLGQSDRAQADVKEALTIDPAHKEAQELLAMTRGH